jgi:hypothetical protein
MLQNSDGITESDAKRDFAVVFLFAGEEKNLVKNKVSLEYQQLALVFYETSWEISQ